MPVGNLGVLMPWEAPLAIEQDLSYVELQWRFVNTNPFATRLRRIPVSQQEFKIRSTIRRPDTVTVTVAAIATDVVLTLADVTYLQNGDTLELTFANMTVEVIEVNADPNEVASTISVLRGRSGTTAGAIPANTVLRLIGNSRTGAETMQKAISVSFVERTNWVQTFQFPVEIAGLTQDTTAFDAGMVAAGAATPLDAHRMLALTNMLNDLERTIPYGRGQAATDPANTTKRAKTMGIKQQLQLATPAGSTVGPYIYHPLDYAAYTPESLLRDLTAGPNGAGGVPDTYFVSTDWIPGLARWKAPLVQIGMGETGFDFTIESFTSGAAAGGIFVVAPRLKKGTLIALNMDDISIRYMREATFFPRGKLGDTWEGDVIGRYGVQLNSPEQSIMIEGIEGFAPV